MGIKLLWTGLTIIEAFNVLHFIPDAGVVGAVIMVIGVILMWLDR